MHSKLPAILAYVLIAALGLAFAWQSASLGYWVDGVAGAGLLPLFAAVPLLLLVALVVIGGLKRIADDDDSLRAPLTAILALMLYAASLPWLGFVLGTLLLMLAWGSLLYRKSWPRALALALVSVLAAVLLFQLILGVPLPLKPAGL
jgi:putative tricarboxylic transport membrane protein